MTIIISGAGISGTSIEPDSPEWKDWFIAQPEGTKIQFEWKDDSLIDRKFTAYRRKRYWEAQKRVDGKLRNTTIKPSEVTYENLRRVGLRLTAYNWAEKFDYEEFPTRPYQTTDESSSQTQDEIRELEQLNEEIRRLNAELKLEREQKENYRSKWERAQKQNSDFFLELKAQRTALDELETQLEELEGGRVTQSKIMGIDLEEFYDAVVLKHPPRERKLITKPLQRFKALIAEALTRRGVPVR